VDQSCLNVPVTFFDDTGYNLGDAIAKPVTVKEDALLPDLLKPGMGDVHWAACR
jgi:hypothetical protein